MAKRIKVGLIGLGRAGWFMICNELDRHKGKYEIVAGCDVITWLITRFDCWGRRSRVCGVT